MKQPTLAAFSFLLHGMIVNETFATTNSKKVTRSEPGDQSVYERGLVTEKVSWQSIVKHQHAFSTLLQQTRNFSGDVLAYVTPWNNHGYDVAKQFGAKFTQVSPVWLQLRLDDGGHFVIAGQHDIDRGWVRQVRDTGAKLLPRILFEGWSGQQILDLATSKGKQSALAQVLSKVAQENDFDGYVFELWSQYNYGGKLAEYLISIVRGLWTPLSGAGLSVVLVIPPPLYEYKTMDAASPKGMFSKKHFDALKEHVSAFSLMTYDYSSPQSPGPNAPIGWVRACVEHLVPDADDAFRKKLLVGLNFYGYDYTAQGGGSAMLGRDFSNMLEKHKPKITWNEDVAEHYVQIRGSEGHHILFFPTLKSISMRVELASQLGTGLSLWETGQGMDYFYDLL